ncbi:hypothetical protein RFI_03912 [Reticulomyxa filosa]|uniref:SAM domain-containing protein n=1 Tax=Reticulomyxa filosa TaxID=46433 RepID=X6P530_RETFI|nr:hypothetical protein RFI_03912 [Reticulomyxa filosa]|eukprot:ETO33194.1 hypothetical protein RFI_03912 [Reticulomyxa filosa]
MTRRDLMKWLHVNFSGGKIIKIEFDYLRCQECSTDAFVHVSNRKIIGEILQEFQKMPEKYKIYNKCVYIRSLQSGVRVGEKCYKYPSSWEDYCGHYKHLAQSENLFGIVASPNSREELAKGLSLSSIAAPKFRINLSRSNSTTDEILDISKPPFNGPVERLADNDGLSLNVSHGHDNNGVNGEYQDNNNGNNYNSEEKRPDTGTNGFSTSTNDTDNRVIQSGGVLEEEKEREPSSSSQISLNGRGDVMQKKSGTQPMEILVQRLKSLVQKILSAEEDLEQKLSLLGVVGSGINLDDDGILNEKYRRMLSSQNQDEMKIYEASSNLGPLNNGNSPRNSDDKNDTQDAFEKQLTMFMKDKDLQIESLKDTLSQMRKDQQQFQVYRKALQAFQHVRFDHFSLCVFVCSHHNLKPLAEKETHLLKDVGVLQDEIAKLQKQLKALCQQEQTILKEMDMVRRQKTMLQENVTSIRCKLEPVTKCLISINAPAVLAKDITNSNGSVHRNGSIDNNSDQSFFSTLAQRKIPNEKRLNELEQHVTSKETKLNYWMRWDEWSLEEVMRWVMDLENGRFLKYTNHLQGLNRISEGSILTAITDVTLQLLGIDNPKDRSDILHHVNTLKKRTKLLHDATMQRKGNLRKVLDLKLSQKEDEEENLCVICLDHKCGPFACVPCGHQCLCEVCKDIILDNKQAQPPARCPICNDNITMIIKLFRVLLSPTNSIDKNSKFDKNYTNLKNKVVQRHKIKLEIPHFRALLHRLLKSRAIQSYVIKQKKILLKISMAVIIITQHKKTGKMTRIPASFVIIAKKKQNKTKKENKTGFEKLLHLKNEHLYMDKKTFNNVRKTNKETLIKIKSPFCRSAKFATKLSFS